MKKSKRTNFANTTIRRDFTAQRLTKYAGLSPIMTYLNRLGLKKELNALFPTNMRNATKFTNVQIMLAVILASMAGVSRLIKIATFTCDALVMALLGLCDGLNKDVISFRFKVLGQRGAIYLQEFVLARLRRWLIESELKSITFDADSTVKTVFGHQEGAAKGYNPDKPGARSYHPLLIFASELKLVVNSWFRTGSAYTSNGICEFIKQTQAFLPAMIEHVFFRADSGFFNGLLFDLLEDLKWTYLVKVKLKNMKALIEKQIWYVLPENPNVAICKFQYQGNDWKKSRPIYGIRSITEWVEVDFMGQKQWVPCYEYACYCSNLPGNALELHEIYKQRATCETWIEQVKSQLLAGTTLTDDFHANDMLWQLSVLAYNLSVMMRRPSKKDWQQEHATFRDWFITLPAILVRGGRCLTMKIYQHYYFKEQWLAFEKLLLRLT